MLTDPRSHVRGELNPVEIVQMGYRFEARHPHHAAALRRKRGHREAMVEWSSTLDRHGPYLIEGVVDIGAVEFKAAADRIPQ